MMNPSFIYYQQFRMFYIAPYRNCQQYQINYYYNKQQYSTFIPKRKCLITNPQTDKKLKMMPKKTYNNDKFSLKIYPSVFIAYLLCPCVVLY